MRINEKLRTNLNPDSRGDHLPDHLNNGLLTQKFKNMKKLIFCFLYLSINHLAFTQDELFDGHVHIWNGEFSVQEYLQHQTPWALK